MVQKVFGICEAKNVTETHELLQTGTDGHQRIWQHAEENPNSIRLPAKEAKKLEDRRTKEKNHKIGVSEASDQV